MTNKYKNRKYEVLPYDKNWARLFGDEVKKIKEIFGDCVIDIQHVGSTAIPGMSGKPTIDILVLVNNLSCGDASISGMEKLGYVSRGEYVAATGRLFVKEKDGHIIFNVHIFQPEHEEAKKMLLLRDFLRRNKDEADNYGSFKLQLFEKYLEDYGMYRKEKDEYLEKLMAKAMKESKNLKKARAVVNYGNLKKEKPLVIVLMGLPGSGKSYLADHLHKKYSFTTLSGENITYAIFGTEKVESGQYKEAYQVLRLVAKDLIEQNFCLVIDGTNLKHEFRKQIYEELGGVAEIVLFYLTTDDDVCLRRANSRGEKHNDPKNTSSKCPPETFAVFKAKLELPKEDEKYFEVKSDDTLFVRTDELIEKAVYKM